MKRNIAFVLLITALVNIAAVLFWKEYYRTLGHPQRWDAPTFEEWDCFYNDCKTINPDL
ncbi:MAG: hypothetical protein PHO92_03440 [Candidatus Peribacteraceae bacterium]|nr:hypothetical protein [Candidatus Peribacteraceae bacterium]